MARIENITLSPDSSYIIAFINGNPAISDSDRIVLVPVVQARREDSDDQDSILAVGFCKK